MTDTQSRPVLYIFSARREDTVIHSAEIEVIATDPDEAEMLAHDRILDMEVEWNEDEGEEGDAELTLTAERDLEAEELADWMAEQDGEARMQRRQEAIEKLFAHPDPEVRGLAEAIRNAE